MMNLDEISRRLLILEPEPGSISAMAISLLELAEIGGHDGKQAELAQQVDFFLEEAHRIVLGWMATGDDEKLRSLLEAVRTALADRGPDGLDDLTLAEQLRAAIGALNQIGATYLRTDNLARLLGALSGRRRERWREVLRWVNRENRPVRSGDLVEEGLYGDDNGAAYALKALTDLRLLRRTTKGPKEVVYELTWSGRGVGNALDAAGAADLEEPQVVVERTRPTPSSWASTWVIEVRGFSHPRMRNEVGLDRDELVMAFRDNPQLAQTA